MLFNGWAGRLDDEHALAANALANLDVELAVGKPFENTRGEARSESLSNCLRERAIRRTREENHAISLTATVASCRGPVRRG